MNLKEAEQCVRDVFGKDTKVFPREDFISGLKKVLRPLEPNEDPKDFNGRLLSGEQLVILGSGKTWEEALRGPVSQEMGRRRAAAAKRAAVANHEGEMFAVFLREKFGLEFETWRLESDLAKGMDADFIAALEQAEKEQEQPAGALKA